MESSKEKYLSLRDQTDSRQFAGATGLENEIQVVALHV
jgi:hypothetical protein